MNSAALSFLSRLILESGQESRSGAERGAERAARVWPWAGPAVLLRFALIRARPRPSIPNPFLPPPTSLRSAGGRGCLVLFSPVFGFDSAPAQAKPSARRSRASAPEPSRRRKMKAKMEWESISGQGVRPLSRSRVEARRRGRGRGGDWGLRGRAGPGQSGERSEPRGCGCGPDRRFFFVLL